MFMKVDLPDPLAPHDRDEFAALDGAADAAQRVHGLLAHAIVLGEVAGLDQRQRHWPALLFLLFLFLLGFFSSDFARTSTRSPA
jgi:hypothetical protein